MKDLADFHNLLMPELPGCTVPMVNLQLVETAREFCRKSSAWRETLDAINLVAEQATYTLALPAGSQLVKVIELEVSDELLWRHTDREPAGESAALTPLYGLTEPPFTLDENLTEITLATDEVPTASETGGLVIKAALTPTAAATQLPDFLLDQQSEAIRYGVLSRLMAMSKKPWTDRELAAYYKTEWNKALNRVAYQASVGNTAHRLRTKPV